MMNKNIVNNIENLVSNLNMFRESKKDVDLTCKEVSEFLKTLPNMTNRPGILVKHHILTRVDRSHYRFCKEPVYFANLKAALEEAYTIAKAERDRYTHKVKAPKNPKTLEEVLTANKISNDDLAKYLVETGNYQISKKVITWEELS